MKPQFGVLLAGLLSTLCGLTQAQAPSLTFESAWERAQSGSDQLAAAQAWVIGRHQQHGLEGSSLGCCSSKAQQRRGEKLVDWGFAENLAYATLVTGGVRVRLTGQDSGRGTFFHRHAVLHTRKMPPPICRCST